MSEELQAFEHEWRNGDRDVARGMARAYVAANRERLSPELSRYDLPGLVRLVEAYRDAGREDDRIITDMWLLSEYEPQRVVGAISIGGAAAIVDAVVTAMNRGESIQ